MYSKEVEALIEESINYSGGNYGCITTQQYTDLLKLIGLDNIKTNLLDLKVGDLIYDFYDKEAPLKLVWTAIEPGDNYNTILNKRCVPLKEVIFPKKMKEIYPLVQCDSYEVDDEPYDPSRNATTRRFRNIIDRINDISVRKGTFVEHYSDTENSYAYIRHSLNRNFLHLTFLIIKLKDYKGISTYDMEQYMQRVNVLVQRDWKTKEFRITSIYGAPFRDGVDPLDGSFITMEMNPGDMLSITYKLTKEPKIADFTFFNSTVRLIGAYETW